MTRAANSLRKSTPICCWSRLTPVLCTRWRSVGWSARRSCAWRSHRIHTYRQVLVQEYTFSPQGATFRHEELRLDLSRDHPSEPDHRAEQERLGYGHAHLASPFRLRRTEPGAPRCSRPRSLFSNTVTSAGGSPCVSSQARRGGGRGAGIGSPCAAGSGAGGGGRASPLP